MTEAVAVNILSDNQHEDAHKDDAQEEEAAQDRAVPMSNRERVRSFSNATMNSVKNLLQFGDAKTEEDVLAHTQSSKEGDHDDLSEVTLTTLTTDTDVPIVTHEHQLRRVIRTDVLTDSVKLVFVGDDHAENYRVMNSMEQLYEDVKEECGSYWEMRGWPYIVQPFRPPEPTFEERVTGDKYVVYDRDSGVGGLVNDTTSYFAIQIRKEHVPLGSLGDNPDVMERVRRDAVLRKTFMEHVALGLVKIHTTKRHHGDLNLNTLMYYTYDSEEKIKEEESGEEEKEKSNGTKTTVKEMEGLKIEIATPGKMFGQYLNRIFGVVKVFFRAEFFSQEQMALFTHPEVTNVDPRTFDLYSLGMIYTLFCLDLQLTAYESVAVKNVQLREQFPVEFAIISALTDVDPFRRLTIGRLVLFLSRVEVDESRNRLLFNGRYNVDECLEFFDAGHGSLISAPMELEMKDLEEEKGEGAGEGGLDDTFRNTEESTVVAATDGGEDVMKTMIRDEDVQEAETTTTRIVDSDEGETKTEPDTETRQDATETGPSIEEDTKQEEDDEQDDLVGDVLHDISIAEDQKQQQDDVDDEKDTNKGALEDTHDIETEGNNNDDESDDARILGISTLRMIDAIEFERLSESEAEQVRAFIKRTWVGLHLARYEPTKCEKLWMGLKKFLVGGSVLTILILLAIVASFNTNVSHSQVFLVLFLSYTVSMASSLVLQPIGIWIGRSSWVTSFMVVHLIYIGVLFLVVLNPSEPVVQIWGIMMLITKICLSYELFGFANIDHPILERMLKIIDRKFVVEEFGTIIAGMLLVIFCQFVVALMGSYAFVGAPLVGLNLALLYFFAWLMSIPRIMYHYICVRTVKVRYTQQGSTQPLRDGLYFSIQKIGDLSLACLFVIQSPIWFFLMNFCLVCQRILIGLIICSVGTGSAMGEAEQSTCGYCVCALSATLAVVYAVRKIAKLMLNVTSKNIVTFIALKDCPVYTAVRYQWSQSRSGARHFGSSRVSSDNSALTFVTHLCGLAGMTCYFIGFALNPSSAVFAGIVGYSTARTMFEFLDALLQLCETSFEEAGDVLHVIDPELLKLKKQVAEDYQELMREKYGPGYDNEEVKHENQSGPAELEQAHSLAEEPPNGDAPSAK